jgi:hypothetical protein
MTEDELGSLAEKIKEFAVDFRELHIEAGSPAYSALADKIGYSKATISRVFAGEKLANWVVLKAMLKVYECDEQTVTAWRRRWASIKRLTDPVLAARELAPPAKQTCEVCEEPVEDMDEHVKQHHRGDGPRLRAI